MGRPGVRQVPEGSGEQGKMEKTGRKIICGAPTTLAVKELMMMMMNYIDEIISSLGKVTQIKSCSNKRNKPKAISLTINLSRAVREFK